MYLGSAGQRVPPLINVIKSTLRNYPDGSQILKVRTHVFRIVIRYVILLYIRSSFKMQMMLLPQKFTSCWMRLNMELNT